MVINQKNEKTYSGEYASQVNFPMGGIGAGMICLNGTGALTGFSLKHLPDVKNNPAIFSAINIKGGKTLVMEGLVSHESMRLDFNYSRGSGHKLYGLPRFKNSSFSSQFPFGKVALSDDRMPVSVEVSGWSPFIPNDEDNSGLPVIAMEYTVKNDSDTEKEGIISINVPRLFGSRLAKFGQKETGNLSNQGIRRSKNGFTMFNKGSDENPEDEGYFNVSTDADENAVDIAWFRGKGSDVSTILWKNISSGKLIDNSEIITNPPSPGASISVPFKLKPGEEKTIRFMISWFVPFSKIRTGAPTQYAKLDAPSSIKEENYRPWYSNRFSGIDEVSSYWFDNYKSLKEKTEQFTKTFYSSTLPEEITEAVAANLSILKSPTILRQYDGRLWGWEGTLENKGSCAGSCTHVWAYAQSIPKLFPNLEKGMRDIEFKESLCIDGWQTFRTPIPTVQINSETPQGWGKSQDVAIDGQCGTIVRFYRDWRINGDTKWMKKHYPSIKKCMDFSIKRWDPDETGYTPEPQHNTYDIEFWGQNGFASSYYLAALKAIILMGESLGEDISRYQKIYNLGKEYLEKELFNGEFFIQKIIWKGLRAGDPLKADSLLAAYSPEASELLKKEGPKYQYGEGCLSDGIIGAWLAKIAGMEDICDSDKIKSHLISVYKYNYKKDLFDNEGFNRAGFALNEDGGLLLCSWPKEKSISLPFQYSTEVWTGIEYQVASHLLSFGKVKEALDIVRSCRKRFNGKNRNPYNEYECGYWYARAMSSYSLIQGITGIRYDAVDKILHIEPQIKGDFTSFISTATGYGTAGIKEGKPFVDIVEGDINIKDIYYVK